LAPLLQTKFYIPTPQIRLVQRAHLIERLYGDRSRRLTLVSAPAGFGKTTLVIGLVDAWSRQSRQPAARLSLDEEDNEWNELKRASQVLIRYTLLPY